MWNNRTKRLLIKFYRFTSMNYVPNYLYLLPLLSTSNNSPRYDDDDVLLCLKFTFSFFHSPRFWCFDRDMPRWPVGCLFRSKLCASFFFFRGSNKQRKLSHGSNNSTTIDSVCRIFWHFKEHAIILYQCNIISPRQSFIWLALSSLLSRSIFYASFSCSHVAQKLMITKFSIFSSYFRLWAKKKCMKNFIFLEASNSPSVEHFSCILAFDCYMLQKCKLLFPFIS